MSRRPERPVRIGAAIPHTVTVKDETVVLTPTETAAAKLDVDPTQIKPIAWLNKAHLNELQVRDLLAPDLARRIEAYTECAAAS